MYLVGKEVTIEWALAKVSEELVVPALTDIGLKIVSPDGSSTFNANAFLDTDYTPPTSIADGKLTYLFTPSVIGYWQVILTTNGDAVTHTEVSRINMQVFGKTEGIGGGGGGYRSPPPIPPAPSSTTMVTWPDSSGNWADQERVPMTLGASVNIPASAFSQWSAGFYVFMDGYKFEKFTPVDLSLRLNNCMGGSYSGPVEFLLVDITTGAGVYAADQLFTSLEKQVFLEIGNTTGSARDIVMSWPSFVLPDTIIDKMLLNPNLVPCFKLEGEPEMYQGGSVQIITTADYAGMETLGADIAGKLEVHSMMDYDVIPNTPVETIIGSGDGAVDVTGAYVLSEAEEMHAIRIPHNLLVVGKEYLVKIHSTDLDISSNSTGKALYFSRTSELVQAGDKNPYGSSTLVKVAGGDREHYRYGTTLAPFTMLQRFKVLAGWDNLPERNVGAVITGQGNLSGSITLELREVIPATI